MRSWITSLCEVAGASVAAAGVTSMLSGPWVAVSAVVAGVGLVLGGGRTAAGQVGGDGTRRVGFNTHKLRTTTAWDFAGGATVSSNGTPYVLANIQEHWDIRGGVGSSPLTMPR